MGFMTEISILNDNWHRLKAMILNDPQSFTREIDTLMNGRPQYRGDKYVGDKWSDEIDVPMTTGYSTVYRSHHADDPRVYIAYQNCFQVLDKYIIEAEYGDRLNDENTIKRLEENVKIAQSRLTEVKKLLKEKREALKAAA